MGVEIITKQDLEEFGERMLAAIRDLMKAKPETTEKWLKSYQVRNMLKISAGTLHNLRANGTLGYTKIGAIFYYKQEDISKLMDSRAPVKKGR